MINLHLSKERDLTSEFINPNWHQSKIKGNKNSLIINSTYNISFSNQNGRQDIQIQFSSVQFFSRVRLFVTQWTAARQASTSPTRRVYSNSCPLSRWWHPTISLSVAPFSSCPQTFPASGSLTVDVQINQPVSHISTTQLGLPNVCFCDHGCLANEPGPELRLHPSYCWCVSVPDYAR